MLSKTGYFIAFFLSLSECRLVNRPENTIALKGSSVTFPCAVSNARNVVIWSFRDMEGNSVLISIRLEIVVKSLRYKVEYGTKSATYRSHDLVIKNIGVEDSGIYKCIDSTDKEEASASLTFLEIPLCSKLTQSEHGRGNKFSCDFKVSGFIGVSGEWNCEFSRNTTSVFTNRSVDQVMGTRTLKVMQYNSSVEAKASNNQDTPACNLTLVSGGLMFESVRHMQFLSKNVPNFKYVLHPVGPPRFNIPDGYKLKKGDFISCVADSPLPVTYNLVVYEASPLKTVQNTTENVTQMNDLGPYRVHCRVSNPLNLKTVYNALNKIEVVSFPSVGTCKFQNCDTSFIHIFGYERLLPLQQFTFEAYCQDPFRIQQCINSNSPCIITSYQQGLMDAYRFLCTARTRMLYANGGTFQSHLLLDDAKLYDKYPYSILPNIYYITLGEDPPQKKSIQMIALNCKRSLDVAKIFYHVYKAYLDNGEEAAEWYKEFYSNFYGIQLYEPKVLRAVEIMNDVNLNECHTFGEVGIKLCGYFKTCDRVYDLLVQAFSYGFILIDDISEFVEHVCEMTPYDMHNCETELVLPCEPVVVALYKPMSVLQNLLCEAHLKDYLKYQECYSKHFVQYRFRKSFQCSRNFLDVLTSFTSSNYSGKHVVEEVCMVSVEFLDCVEQEVRKRCGKLAARLQRTLLRMMLSVALEDYFCFKAFTHSNYDVGAGHSLVSHFHCFWFGVAIFILLHF